MKIINLIKSEFLKNYTVSKIIIICSILLLSAFIISKFSTYLPTNDVFNDVNYSIEQLKKELEKENNLIREYKINNIEINIRKMEYIQENKLSNNEWKYYILEEIASIEDKLFVYKKYKESSSYFEEIENIESENIKYYLKSVDLNNVDDLIKTTEIKLDKYKEILNDDAYYKYVEIMLEETNNKSKEEINNSTNQEEIKTITEKIKREEKIYSYIIEEKIKEEDHWKVVVVKELVQLYSYYDQKLVEEDSFNPEFQYGKIKYDTYEDYVKGYKEKKETTKSSIEILLYSLENNIKPELRGEMLTSENKIMTGKTILNNIFHLGIIIVLILSITNSGIVASEHNYGTIKLLCTTPNKRWKILLSKFLYLILNLLIMYLISLIFLSIFAIAKYGVSDLLEPKLLYIENKVIETNYLAWLLKNMFIGMLPMIAVMSILLFLSSITLNTALTTGITSIISAISFIAWYLVYIYNLKFLIYTPIPYLSFADVVNKTEYFTKSSILTNCNMNLGIIISIIFITLFYSLTHFI